MEKNKTVVPIGDIHGLAVWKEIVNSPENKDRRFVFLGDYIDPYEDIGADELLSNLIDIIEFKKAHPDDVILLLGNHDMHYLYEDFPEGSRYDARIAERFTQILEENRQLFLFAYQEGKTIYSHAGITNRWWNDDFVPLIDKSSLPYKNGILDIAELINNADDNLLRVLGQVGYSRGGFYPNGGIFWEDKYVTSSDPLSGYCQFVGHTRVSKLETYNIDSETQITFCDCLFIVKGYTMDSATAELMPIE